VINLLLRGRDARPTYIDRVARQHTFAIMDLDNIWDEPAEQIVSSKSREPLFLPEQEEDDFPMPPPRVESPPPPPDIDLDEMFANVEKDDDDDMFNFKPAGSNLDIEALKRKAEARARRSASSPLLGEISAAPSSSPGPAEDRPNEEKGKKERRKPVKLDEGRLLGESGFPQLVKDTKHFKIKGKGHEVRAFVHRTPPTLSLYLLPLRRKI
jgi:replication fork protection complex subunit Csm3/Swi3